MTALKLLSMLMPEDLFWEMKPAAECLGANWFQITSKAYCQKICKPHLRKSIIWIMLKLWIRFINSRFQADFLPHSLTSLSLTWILRILTICCYRICTQKDTSTSD